MSTTTEYPLTWDLDSLLPHPETDEFQAELTKLQADLRELAEASGQLPPISADDDAVSRWKEFLKRYEPVWGRMLDMRSFIGCHAAADARNTLFQRLEARLAALEPLRSRITTNLEFACRETEAGDLEAFAAADAWLSKIRFYLEDSRENARLRLPREQESLAADLAVDGIHAWGRLYDRISGALKIQVMEHGELVEKSPSQVQFDSPERSVRQNNFYAADRAWAGIAEDCADALNHLSGTRLTLYGRLGLQDHLDAPLRYNRLQRETLETMWSAISGRKKTLTAYLQKKADLLGIDQMTWYDITAPLPRFERHAPSPKIDYDTACGLIGKTFDGFSGEFGDFAERALREGWVEAENRAGKRQGGFCTGFYSQQQSRIFMTYTDTADSMSTLAHELGHAWHSYVLRDQPLYLQDYPMNLAETASTFAEAVLGEHRLEASTSATEQLSMLDNMLGDAVAFLMNIHARFLFEDRYHQERLKGELPAERFSELMQSAQQEAYAGALADDGWNPRFWVSKLHFYISELPFYNFPYTFGYLLSLGLYAVAGESGEDFPEKYRELLLATGSMNSEEAVQSTFGYDLREPTFWNRSLDIVEARVNRFMELAD